MAVPVPALIPSNQLLCLYVDVAALVIIVMVIQLLIAITLPFRDLTKGGYVNTISVQYNDVKTKLSRTDSTTIFFGLINMIWNSIVNSIITLECDDDGLSFTQEPCRGG